MFGKLSLWISAIALTIVFTASGSVAEAAVRKTNLLSNVRTRIIPNWNNTGADVCFVYNANNASVSTLISVFPTGTLLLAADTLTYPVVLGPFSGARVYSWTPLLPASEYCKVMVVR
jgi:hypothetical protein